MALEKAPLTQSLPPIRATGKEYGVWLMDFLIPATAQGGQGLSSGAWVIPSGRKRPGRVGARNHIGSLELSPVLIPWKGKKL